MTLVIYHSRPQFHKIRSSCIMYRKRKVSTNDRSKNLLNLIEHQSSQLLLAKSKYYTDKDDTLKLPSRVSSKILYYNVPIFSGFFIKFIMGCTANNNNSSDVFPTSFISTGYLRILGSFSYCFNVVFPSIYVYNIRLISINKRSHL